MAAWGKSRDHARAQPQRRQQRDLMRRPQGHLETPPGTPGRTSWGVSGGLCCGCSSGRRRLRGVLGLYRSLGALLQAESGLTRTLLSGAELELLRRRRRLRGAAGNGGAPWGRGGGPSTGPGVSAGSGGLGRGHWRSCRGPESPEPEEGGRGGPPPTLPLPHPEETPETRQETHPRPPQPGLRTRLGSTDPQVSLSPRVRALSQHLQQLRGEVEALRGQLRGSHLGGDPPQVS
ncbi:uncharacterized protein LOC127462928 [Manacus candei]|uniref:uncharacterized protein LOC127462928 n=1 Tax=Manacus candei TaxID=415023 RepID=UPI0022277F5F|nr:uncharacterized protein LOC127462928 [Manacus candei]